MNKYGEMRLLFALLFLAGSCFGAQWPSADTACYECPKGFILQAFDDGVKCFKWCDTCSDLFGWWIDPTIRRIKTPSDSLRSRLDSLEKRVTAIEKRLQPKQSNTALVGDTVYVITPLSGTTTLWGPQPDSEWVRVCMAVFAPNGSLIMDCEEGLSARCILRVNKDGQAEWGYWRRK